MTMLLYGLNIRHNNFQNNIIDFSLYYERKKKKVRKKLERKKIFKIVLLRLVLAVLCVLCL